MKRANSAADLFKICTDPKPDGLGIQDSVVLGTNASPVLDEYTKFLNDVAKKENWVKSLVAMIPCVQVRSLLFCIRMLTSSWVSQSYSMIAETLEMELVHNGQSKSRHPLTVNPEVAMSKTPFGTICGSSRMPRTNQR